LHFLRYKEFSISPDSGRLLGGGLLKITSKDSKIVQYLNAPTNLNIEPT